MNAEKSGDVNGTFVDGRRGVCAHQRLVDEHVNFQGEKTGSLVCRECGEVFHKPVEA